MRAQRSLFFGPSPERSAPRLGANRPVPQRRFPSLRGRDLSVRFTHSTVTAYGGYPLWDGFARRCDLNGQLGRHLRIPRGSHGFRPAELSRFFIDSRILGAQRLMDVDAMRTDALLTRSYGIDGLPSDETLGRYFKSFGSRHLSGLDRLNRCSNERLWRRAQGGGLGVPRDGRIVVDYDSSTMTVYGQQEGADRGRCFRKKDKPGFQPKFAFIGGLGLMVHQRLYPQSTNLPKDFESFHAETLARLPKTARVWAIRGDGALYSEKRIEWLEPRYSYAISAMMTPELREIAAVLPEEAWIDGTDSRGRPYSVSRIAYRPSTWSRQRTFILSRRLRDDARQQVLWDSERYRYFAYVTNYPASPVDQYRFCVERCSLESFIKESKNGFHYDALPCSELDANRAYLGHVQLAYNMLIWWKLFEMPQAVNRWTIDTIRTRLLAIPGQLKRSGNRWLLSLPRTWPWQPSYLEIAAASGLSPP